MNGGIHPTSALSLSRALFRCLVLAIKHELARPSQGKKEREAVSKAACGHSSLSSPVLRCMPAMANMMVRNQIFCHFLFLIHFSRRKTPIVPPGFSQSFCAAISLWEVSNGDLSLRFSENERRSLLGAFGCRSLFTRVYATHVDLSLGLGFWRPR